MLEIKTYKKDNNKSDTEKIIARIYDGKIKYIITSKQAIQDYYKSGLLVYDKMTYNYKLAKKIFLENKIN